MNAIAPKHLFSEISQLIEQSRGNIAKTVNAEMTMLYWNIGKRINAHILNNERAEYGKQVVANLAKQLSVDYGSSFSEKNIRRMMQFADVFPDEVIVVSLIRQLSWTHLIALIPLQDSLKREFYIEMCKMDNWSVRTLRERINSMLYERTAISRKPEQTIINDLEKLRSEQKMNPDMVFKDPYFLDFLGLKNTYSEKDLESAILAELQNFIIELGSDFAFLARQKRIIFDNEDYYIDLLFFHRRLRCLVAIDLKNSKFEASHKGQMELYLRWLEKYEMAAGENTPIGLILCTGKNEESVELLQLDKSNIRVADYLTQLPDKKLLESKLRQSVKNAKLRLMKMADTQSADDEY